MSTKAVNKVIFGGNTLIDITDTTATADQILVGYTAYGADGVKMNGAATPMSNGIIYQDENGYIVIAEGSAGDTLLQSKTVTPTTSQQVLHADNGYDALYSVTVNPIPSEYVIPSQEFEDGDVITFGTPSSSLINVGQIDSMIVGEDNVSNIVGVGEVGFARI